MTSIPPSQREWTFRRLVAELPFIPATSNWLKLLLSLLAEPLMFISSLCIIAETVLPGAAAWPSILTDGPKTVMSLAPEIILPGCFQQAQRARRRGDVSKGNLLFCLCALFGLLTLVTLASFMWHFSDVIANFILFIRCGAGISYTIILNISGHDEQEAHPSQPARDDRIDQLMQIVNTLTAQLTTVLSITQNNNFLVAPLPFNEGDVTYFRPLYQQTVVALSQFPTHLTADAAYDAWYVYEPAARHGGIAAVPLNAHTANPSPRDRDGVPLCSKGLRMLPTFQFAHTSGYRAQHFQCPLLFPQATGEACDHQQFLKGKGCVKDLNWELGGLQRVLLDRSAPLYKAVYTQRTSCERINSQAKELGIEHPKVHNRRSVANLNTLIYLIINGHALDRVKSINRGLLQMS